VNLDLSVAPEIAQLIGPAGPPGPGLPAGPTATIGELARQLRLITAAPERWWGLVRFDPERPVRAGIPLDGPAEAWLMIIPPSAQAVSKDRGGDRGRDRGRDGGWAAGDCGCEVVTVVAGEVTEQAIGGGGVATTPLLPGKMRVHGTGQLHQVINRSAGYTVSVHARQR
jgi:hypothetical protein